MKPIYLIFSISGILGEWNLPFYKFWSFWFSSLLKLVIDGDKVLPWNFAPWVSWNFWEEQFDQQTYGLAPGTINQLRFSMAVLRIDVFDLYKPFRISATIFSFFQHTLSISPTSSYYSNGVTCYARYSFSATKACHFQESATRECILFYLQGWTVSIYTSKYV